ncbi:MAG: GIY-YIG nuclease family protein, partial [Chlorobi bacterium]|nr:GIY-YIG nuclease family protein [Chlorobiota bacterium]
MNTAGSGGQVRLSDHNFEYVYILRCSNNKTYVGHTSNLEKRLERHINGYVPATKNIRPVELKT